MRSKDQFLLEEAYSQIVRERWENINTPNYICVNQNDGEYHTFSDFDEAKNACDQFNSDDNTKVWVVKYDGDVVYPKESEVGTSDMSYAKKGEYVESFVHGIQPISEAKKKVNPYAVCTATVGRENEEKYKSCKKKVAKSAKKSGKKVTTDKVKKK